MFFISLYQDKPIGKTLLPITIVALAIVHLAPCIFLFPIVIAQCSGKKLGLYSFCIKLISTSLYSLIKFFILFSPLPNSLFSYSKQRSQFLIASIIVSTHNISLSNKEINIKARVCALLTFLIPIPLLTSSCNIGRAIDRYICWYFNSFHIYYHPLKL